MKYIAIYDEDLDSVREILNHHNIEYEDEPYVWDIAFEEEIRNRYEDLDDYTIEYITDVLVNDPYLNELICNAIEDEYKTYLEEH